jgi:tRNA modification GTPase
MRDFLQGGPIIAPSTCTLGNGAIALIRISGFSDLDTLRGSFTLSGPIEPRKVYYTQLKHDELHLDDICLTYFAGPKSYTGENVLELSVHGN